MPVNYSKHNFTNGQILSAEHLNSIEDGICQTCDQINKNAEEAKKAQEKIEDLKYLFLVKEDYNTNGGDAYFRYNINDDTQKLTLWDILGHVPTYDELSEFISRHNIYYVYNSLSHGNDDINIIPLQVRLDNYYSMYVSAWISRYNKYDEAHSYYMHGYVQGGYGTERYLKMPIIVEHVYNSAASITTNKYIRQVTIGSYGNNDITFDVAGQLQGGSWLFTDYAVSNVTGDYTAMFGYHNTCFGNGNICGGIKNNITGRAICAVGENNLVEQCATGAIIGGTFGYINDANVVMAIGNGTSADNRSNIFEIKKNGTITLKPHDKDAIALTYDSLLKLSELIKTLS